METIGDRLRHAIELRDTSQSALAREVELESQAISAICNKDRVPLGTNAVKIADALHVRVRWLLFGEPPMEPVGKDEAERLCVLLGAMTPEARAKVLDYAQDMATLHPVQTLTRVRSVS